MMLELQSRLADEVREIVKSSFDVDLARVVFQYPPRSELGDLALTAPFDLAKQLRRKPRDIAEQLASGLAEARGVRDTQVAGAGFVNLFLDRATFARHIHEALRAVPSPAGGTDWPRVIVEHTSINPNKAAHVGHLRNAVLGDTYVRVLRSRGREVEIQNYIDDTGVQVADVVVGFLHLEKKTLAEVESIEGRFDYYCWDLYARVGQLYAEDPERRTLQAETLHAIENGSDPAAAVARHVSSRIVDCHLDTMARLGIRYDLIAHESHVLGLHFWDRAFELMKRAGTVRLETDGKAAGCWVLGMEQEDGADEDKILVRSSGTVTYTGKDIAYQLWKLGRLGLDFSYVRHRDDTDGHVLWSTTTGDGVADPPQFAGAGAVYNVIDVGQSYPQRVVKAGVAALEGEDAANASHHLGYEKVVLSAATAKALGYLIDDSASSVPVSGRKGLGVKADDLIDALIAKARSEIDERDPDRPVEEREATARAVAVGALRYFLVRFARTKVITFDMDEALAFVGETGPYIQNGLVRARNILTKLEAAGHDVAALLKRAHAAPLGPMLATPEGEEVWSLFVAMARSDEIAEQVALSGDVAPIAKHAFGLAQSFHSYYQNPRHTVLRAESDDLRAFRTLVVDSFVAQMSRLCDVLGIPVPTRM